MHVIRLDLPEGEKTQKFLQDCTDEHYRHRDALCVPPVANYPGAQIERDFLTSCGCTGGTALDIGAGNGNFLALLTQMGFDCLGIEPNPPRAAVVRDAGLRVLER